MLASPPVQTHGESLPADEAPAPEQMTPTLPYGVGIDTHKLFIQVCILYQRGAGTERVEQEFQTTWIDLAKARKWIVTTLTTAGHFTEGDLLRYTIESTGCYHLPVCQALGGTPTIINPMLAGPTRRKTDVLDARMLAHHSIIALWRPSYVLTPDAEILRCLIAMRNECTRGASRLINRVNNHCLRFGHTLGRDGSMADMQRRAIVEDMCRGVAQTGPALGPAGIPQNARTIFLDSYKLYDGYKAMGKQYHKLALDHLFQHHWPTGAGPIDGRSLLKILTSVPSVGEVTALVWLSVIHDPRRFADKKQVAAFCGSDPSVKVSAGKTTSHIKRKGNSVLHHALKNCASMIVRRHKDPLGQWGYNILRRQRKGSWGKAISAVARRLCICLWHVHLKAVPFSFEQYRFYLAPDVPELPISAMGLSKQFENMLHEAELYTTGEVARAFLTTLPQQKGIGVACLTAVKQWLDLNRVKPQGPPPKSPATMESPPDLPSSRPNSGVASQMTKAALSSSGPSLAETVASFLHQQPTAAKSAQKSRTASKPRKAK